MKNREAAKLICMEGCSQYTNKVDCSKNCATFKTVMKMAKWKDEQMEKSIQQLFEKLHSAGYNERVKSGFEIFKFELTNKRIRENK